MLMLIINLVHIACKGGKKSVSKTEADIKESMSGNIWRYYGKQEERESVAWPKKCNG